MARITHLKVRIKELAFEASHIRHECRRVRTEEDGTKTKEWRVEGRERWELNHHRTTVVRPAARRYQLAYACLRAMPYEVVETRVRPDRAIDAKHAIKAAAKIAKKFGGEPELIATWSAAAIKHIETQLLGRLEAA